MHFDDFIGQQNVKDNLELLIQAAKLGREFPHIGLYGPAGSGKTTLAEIICEELNAEAIYINGSAVTSSVVFRGPIVKAVKKEGLQKRYIIIVDECHALPRKIQNTLLSVLEKPAILCTVVERKTPLPNGKVLMKGDILKERLPPNVSFIFCTTDKSKLSHAMESRLHPINLVDYSLEDKVEVVINKFHTNNVTLENSDYELVAKTAKNMRHLSKICDRMFDFAAGQSLTVMSHDNVQRVMDILGIDKFGCDAQDRKYLDYVKSRGPIALSNISRYLNVDDAEVKEKIEPFLIRNDWIEITSRGRVVTKIGLQQIYGQESNFEIDDIMEMFND
jgi:Holliday junction DNA helicase RuvB